MQLVTLGYYDRGKVRTPLDKGMIRAAYGDLPKQVRAEAFDGYIVLTDLRGPRWTQREHDR